MLVPAYGIHVHPTPSPIPPVFHGPAQTTFMKYLFCAGNCSKPVHVYIFFLMHLILITL